MRCVLVLILLLGCSDRGIGAGERGRLLAMRPVWIAAARAERCPRPALRAPASGNGSARLLRLNAKGSAEWRCLVRVQELQPELGPCAPAQHCEPPTLASIKPHPDVVEACAPLYASIEQNAHASEACSPTTDTSWKDDEIVALLALDNAVRLEVAPLVAKGQLGEASERVVDAIRFADDYGRKATLIGAMLSTVSAFRFADTLDEIAIDPRLTADEGRAIARDLDTLLASAPRWDAIMRQEQAWVANFIASRSKDMVPTLAILDAQARGVRRACSGTLRDCVEHLDDVKVDNAADFTPYARRLGLRDSALAFVRMQIELRLARPQDCSDPVRRRALLAPWADRAVVGDEPDPVVTPPAWQRDPEYPLQHAPRALRCVFATL